MKKGMNAIETIRTCVHECTYGWKNTHALTMIAKAVGEIRAEAGSHGDVREVLGRLNGWVDKLYSSRKHVAWGIETVRDFVLSDCYSLELCLQRIAKGKFCGE
jgi:hypothetical protein